MLSNKHLSNELREVSSCALALAEAVAGGPDLPPRALAVALVTVVKVSTQLQRLRDRLSAADGVPAPAAARK
jgi:hypothetical protein